MDIEERTNRFVSLLRADFNTRGKTLISLGETTLEENGLSGSTLWEIICPALEKEGVLAYYNNPYLPYSAFNAYLVQHPGILSPNDPTDMAGRLREKFSHKFVVDKDKLMHLKPTELKHIVIDDTPDGANWTSLKLRFTTGRTLLAVIPLQNWHSDVIDRGQLGLDKKKGGWPKEPWKLLEEASKHNGLISLTSSKGADKESKRRQINTLQNLLKAVFPKLRGKPLEPRGGDGYQTVFEILPEQREEDALQE